MNRPPCSLFPPARRWLVILGWAFGLAWPGVPTFAQSFDRTDAAPAALSLVDSGRSSYVIHHAADAAETTRQAAHDLRRVIKRATGASLEIVLAPTTAPAIRLVARDDLPHDGFEIRQSGADVVIAGNDRQRGEPGDAWFTPSHGTLYGVCEFLERFVGVRWLFPGELGEDVPRRAALAADLSEPVRGAPSFQVRSLAYVGESDPGTTGRPKAATLAWMRSQRLTNGLHPHVAGFGHSWDDYLRPDDLDAHPEWRPAAGESVRNGKVTYFCTTAPGLVDLFARRVIETIDRYPTREMFSISPTDGGGFCTCARCEKLVTTDPHGRRSHARAILEFYRQVARIVGQERPGRRLGGFVYYNYQYPPDEAPRLPDNLALCWAPLNYYGYGLLKAPYRDEFERVLGRWTAIAPRFAYHDYSTWMRSFHGAPLPPAFDILRREVAGVGRRGAWSVRMVGDTAWGVHAPINYVLAKQMWNSRLDVERTYDEWLERAYGPGWRTMRRTANELDAAMQAHKSVESLVYKGSQYEVNEEVLRAVYLPKWESIESNYQTTLAACETDDQRRRLAMYGDNLIRLHYALRQAGLIPADRPSSWRRDDVEYAKFLDAMEDTFSLFRDSRGLYRGPIWKGEWRGP